MRLLFRMLLVGLVMVGLSGGMVSAGVVMVEKPFYVSFQIPEGHEATVVAYFDFSKHYLGEESFSVEYELTNSSFDSFVFKLTPLSEYQVRGDSKASYVFDHYRVNEERVSMKNFYGVMKNVGDDLRFITLNNGHRAKLFTYFSRDASQEIEAEVFHCGYRISLYFKTKRAMTEMEKKLANQILMSLDF